MEKLTIQNFLGLRKIEIEIDRINILIGPQAAGKSICAKLCYFFKGFVKDLFSAVENEKTKRELDSSFIKKFEELFPSQTWGKTKFKIRYEINEYFIEIIRDNPKKTKLHLAYSDFYKKELNRLRRHFNKNIKMLEDEDYDRSRAFYRARQTSQQNLIDNIGIVAGNSQLFIPAGRSFFANLQSSIFSFLSSNKAIDPFLTEFGSFYESVKRYPIERRMRNEEQKKLKEKIDVLIEKILCGKHVKERGKDYLVSSDYRRTNISNASSGQQEMLPLAIILRFIPFTTPWRSGYSTYIEEPEAHLFPSAQRTIVELIATIYNNTTTPLQFFITTHSPYILTSFNNLIHAGSIYKNLAADKKNVLLETVPKDQLLSIEGVKAYSLSEGKCQEMKCDDSGLITADIIDAVSDDLSMQFDKLLDLE